MRKPLVAVLAMAAAVLGGAGAAQADARIVHSVPTAGLDLTDAASVKVLHERLRRAAREVCSSGYVIATQQIAAERNCAEEVTAQAVAKLDRPLLTALQQQRQQAMTARGY